MATNSAVMKLRKNEQVVSMIHDRVGVPMRYLPVLAALEIAGAVGVLIGLAFAPLGIAASGGLIAYFIGAVISHLRVRDIKNAAMPVAPLALAVAVFVLRITTA